MRNTYGILPVVANFRVGTQQRGLVLQIDRDFDSVLNAPSVAQPLPRLPVSHTFAQQKHLLSKRASERMNKFYPAPG